MKEGEVEVSSVVKVLFVCMGNICRSPMAEGVFRQLISDEKLTHLISTDSAGTHAYHIGEPPDRRAQATAQQRGVTIDDLRARKVAIKDFSEFDYLLAMDKENLQNLQAICPPALKERIFLFLSFAPHLKYKEVPDPYYGGQDGFEQVFDLVTAASQGLLSDIRQRFQIT